MKELKHNVLVWQMIFRVISAPSLNYFWPRRACPAVLFSEMNIIMKVMSILECVLNAWGWWCSCCFCRMDDAEACFILSSRNEVDRTAAVITLLIIFTHTHSGSTTNEYVTGITANMTRIEHCDGYDEDLIVFFCYIVGKENRIMLACVFLCFLC